MKTRRQRQRKMGTTWSSCTLEIRGGFYVSDGHPGFSFKIPVEGTSVIRLHQTIYFYRDGKEVAYLSSRSCEDAARHFRALFPEQEAAPVAIPSELHEPIGPTGATGAKGPEDRQVEEGKDVWMR